MLEVILNQNISKVELLKKEGNKVSISINEHIYDLDIIMVENGVYSILLDNKSYNVELVRLGNPKKYFVNTLFNTYELEIVDAQSRYQKSRSKGIEEDQANVISSPMPGKIIKIPVKAGDDLKAGDTAIIVEAMKMQSEYKVKKDCKVKEVQVHEGDTIDSNQVLIVVECP